jgi:hypothetical protein
MTSPEPLVRFYDLSGPKPWSPACWRTRYALNYKRIPYTVTKLSYPDIKPTCEKLVPSMEGLHATVPIIEILAPPYAVLNDSTPIAELLNERFTEKDGYRELKGIEETKKYEEETLYRGRAIFRWICYDVWANALDENDGSKEFFRSTREERLGCPLKDILKVRGGGEEAVIEDHKVQWLQLKERMSGEDGKGEREFSSQMVREKYGADFVPTATYLDFYDASQFKWIEAANAEKGKKLMNLYGDDTFVKLMNKVKDYET